MTDTDGSARMTASPTNEPAADFALAGLKVVSMAEQYPGPFCTMILTDMGADVIQVERPGGGDPSRFLKPFYESLNRGKRSVALDIRDPQERERLRELIASADVFLEGFRPGKLAAHGLGYDDLARLNPRLVYCSISGYGQTGPYRDRPAHDLTIQGVAGALHERIAGDVTGLPPATLLGDGAAALFAVIGVLSALTARNRTGRGTFIDVAMTDAVLAMQTPFIASAAEDGPAPPQAEPAYDVFRCADGRFLSLSIAHEDAYWSRLCGDLGLPDVAGLSRPERVSARQELQRRIAGEIARFPFSHWASRFEASGQMWGPAHALKDVGGDPQIAARGLIETLERTDGTAQPVVRQPIRFSAYANAPLRRAPDLGEHADARFE